MTRLARLVLAAQLLAAPALAAPPPEIEAELLRIGRVVAPPETARLYAPLHAGAPWEGVAVTRDAAYGPDARHRLDVFTPAAAGPPRPVLVFVHGGAFVAGDKWGAGGIFYPNIAVWAARQGFVGVNITYRLAPQNPYPAAQEDIGAALAWVGANIAGLGGDPAEVTLMGHSAGASHVASYAAEPHFHPAGVPDPARYVFVSGIFDLTRSPEEGRVYFGADPAQRAERSAIRGLAGLRQPMLLAWAELNPPMFITQAEALRDALCAAGRCGTALPLPGHSHMSEVYAIGTADTALTGPLLEFLRR